MSIPPNISNEEPLLRAYSVPSGLEDDNSATPLVFRLRKNEGDISLTRRVYDSLLVFLNRALSTFTFTHISPLDVAAGAVELLAEEINAIDPQHVVLQATPTKSNPAHASIFLFLPDGTRYIQSRKTSIPADPSILGYELALANAVRAVYDRGGNVIWVRA